ncbi:Cys-tRNA(Pro) deacylase [Prolixibacter sp. SD074]|jgi:Cys-tRNA(Pro)/Cys-tRNA(Cys) deacylase|uniref:Cys-tRNA(Pro) deacylase n=1 Tax=Prolixibacter sp. SD074 TaxID=2652391 RepID=UPI00126F6DF0|nr:Cys-tRNA(Pro) deacylase [Prolixibacter sp. SD074]GET30459.1 Cys-tRNA(Pro)/Cys-tRNA(Cys) deacylase [Prolixibacter sp. SD074]
MKKTNAARILDRLKINYKLVEYTVDENDLSAEHLAETARLPVEKVYKTLVARGDRNGIFVCVVPGAVPLNLKKAAKASGNKKAAMVLMKELEPLTGYIRGGCSPLGMKKNYPVFIDESAFEQEKIFISAGQRGLQLHLTPSDLQKATGARAVPLT